MYPSIRERDTLEIIIDTCSLGTAQLRAIDTLVSAVLAADPRVYKDYRIVIPVQLGAEVRQRIYPQFLREEMKRSQRWDDGEYNLRKFWHKHLDHIEIADTNISQAYRLQYAKTALPMLEEKPELTAQIVSVAQMLAIRYGAKNDILNAMNIDDFAAFKAQLSDLISRQETAVSKTRHRLSTHHTNTDLTDKQLGKIIATAEIANLARHQRTLEKELPPEGIYFMQALYSEPELYKAVSATPSFKAFRFNKGERAIEDFVFHERTETNTKLVSLIVSEDAEARDEIKALRKQSKNSVIVVSNKGLLAAVSYLTDPELHKQASSPKATMSSRQKSAQQRWYENPENPRAPRIASTLKAAEEKPAPLDDVNEMEWALRLTSLLNKGEWRKTPSRRHHSQHAL